MSSTVALAVDRARREDSPVQDWSRRFSALALSSIACSVVTAVASLVVFLRSLPPTDEAYGEPLFALLVDPFILLIAIPATIVGAVFGFAAALSFLLDTDLRKSVPVTMVGTTGAAVLCAAAGSILGAAIVGFFSGLVTMMACNDHFPRYATQRVRRKAMSARFESSSRSSPNS